MVVYMFFKKEKINWTKDNYKGLNILNMNI